MNTTALVEAKPGHNLASKSALKKTVKIKSRLGLHARPAALLIDALRPFQCRIQVESRGGIANAKSILGLLSLGAPFGADLTFIAAGTDAPQALHAIEQLFAGDFGD